MDPRVFLPSPVQLVPAIFRVVNQVYGTPGRNITWEPSMGQPFNVWMTGHSLGGALATLCAMDLRSRVRACGLAWVHG